MRPWNEIIKEKKEGTRIMIEEQYNTFQLWINNLLNEGYDLSNYTWDEVYAIYEKYYGPNEKLPSGKTPSQKNKKKAKKFQQSGEMHGTETGPERADRMRKTFKGAVELRKTQKEKSKKEPYGPGNPSFDLAAKREKRKRKQLKFSMEQARKNAEERKKKELENIKNKPRQAASAALSKIDKPQIISHRGGDATAYTKALGNVGSLAGGVAKAGISYGIARHLAKKEAEAIKNDGESKIPNKKPSKSGPLGGRPPSRPPNIKEKYFDWREELLSENNSIENLHEFLPALLAALESGGAAEAAFVASGAGRAVAAGETGLGSKVSNVIKKSVKNKLGDGDNSSNSQSSSSSSEEPISSNDSSATAYTKALSNVGKIFSREEFVAEVEDKEAKRKKIIDVMRGKNKIEINPNIKEERDEEGGMARNELDTMERAVKTLRKKIKSSNQQLPAWVQSKISKAVDHIDTVADYMSGETEPVSEECGCEDDKKKVLAMMIIKKAVDAKKKKNFQLNSGIIGEASAAWQRKEGKNPEGGLNKKGIASYRKEHPGSHLSLAVTTKPSKLDPDSKAAKRRKSFCARMSGMPGPMKDEKGRPTRKALSLRKWNC